MEIIKKEHLNMEILPAEAKKELEEFYSFLLFKYKKKINKEKEIKELFGRAKGKLPFNYKFNREEAHER